MQDRIYASEQIKIPPEFPEILKQYSKQVLAEQPTNLIDFSIKYFGRLAAENEVVKTSNYHPDLKIIKVMYQELSSS